jgi:hypothetical protein
MIGLIIEISATNKSHKQRCWRRPNDAELTSTGRMEPRDTTYTPSSDRTQTQSEPMSLALQIDKSRSGICR